MTNELQTARLERDTAFTEFLECSSKADRYTLKARAARTKYMLASDAVRAGERDLLSFPII